MKNNPKNNFKTLIIIFLFMLSGNVFSQSIYTNDMDYVLGDVKQRFITGAVTTEAQVLNLLKGFKTMRVNGIRIPIFPEGENPQPEIMEYFYEQAMAQGFPIFANPAQDSGGRRIASGSLKSADLIATENNQAATETLIRVVSEFALNHPGLKWMNPFNEDGRPGNGWSIAQMNEIYSRLKTNLETYFDDGQIPSVPEIIGPCVWGLPASIIVMRDTNVSDYITVATSHNLGFNNGQWTTFINLAKQKNLPVWDSEVNNSSNGGLSRIDTAIENKVDGLVIYNSGNTINMGTGKIGGLNEIYMSKYLKPRENLALNDQAIATQSTTLASMPASNAIDGDISGSYNGGNGSISIAGADGQGDVWWQVDLGSDQKIGSVKLFNRTDACCINRMSDYSVTIFNSSNTVVFNQRYTDIPDQAVELETGDVTGRIVKVQQYTGSSLSLAEVQVFESSSALSTTTEEKPKVTIYPNPVLDNFTVLAPNADFNTYTLYNIKGQKISTDTFENNANGIDINVSGLSKGIYLLKLEGARSSVTHKIVKE
ncbi:T9SS type A sorting domain-containing protein [uncultured Polaribacter sp.]|uniref:galactose-binding domain-containing protein n=1 Tax=uncultured Polaribacter sp. TaxID=174711 RepID=UPI0026274A39|nr:T9SS type A sorting domain-containing protein [uncultured Polaribacter sp.]